MSTTDKKIAEVLSKFGEPMAGNVWRVQGTAVIYHKALERIAAVAGIRFEDPKILRAERDEAVILVTGEMDVGEVVAGTQTLRPRREWSIGEACIGTNYRVSGKQAAYPFAMAEKRAKDRVILKLIELAGEVYSEEEADEFKQSAPSRAGAEMAGGEASNRATSPPAASADPFGLPPLEEKGDRSIANTLISALKQSKTEAELDGWVRNNKAAIRGLPGPLQDEVVHAGSVHRSALQYAEETA